MWSYLTFAELIILNLPRSSNEARKPRLSWCGWLVWTWKGPHEKLQPIRKYIPWIKKKKIVKWQVGRRIFKKSSRHLFSLPPRRTVTRSFSTSFSSLGSTTSLNWSSMALCTSSIKIYLCRTKSINGQLIMAFLLRFDEKKIFGKN